MNGEFKEFFYEGRAARTRVIPAAVWFAASGVCGALDSVRRDAPTEG